MRTCCVVAAMWMLALLPARGAGETVLTLRETAQVTGERLELGEIADISGPAEQAQCLAALDIGPAPLPGHRRLLTLGYLKMRLRRWGVREEGLSFEGASQVTVSAAAPAPRSEPEDGEPTSARAPMDAPAPVSVRRGGVVRLTVDCGGVRIVAAATVLEDACVGDIVRLRIDQTRRTIRARLDAPDRASLVR